MIDKTFEVIRFSLISPKVVAMENHRAIEGCGYRVLLVQNFRFCEAS